jgi:RNA polymerase sigma-70 factor (ECF subfamily)
MNDFAATGSPPADVDAALMVRVRRGDRDAFAQLYDRNARSVVNFAYRFVQDRARAEELTQEIFLKLHRSASSYTPSARFKTFLFRIAANHCLNERRRGEYKVESAALEQGADTTAQTAAPGAEGPDEALVGRELERALGAALEALPARERIAFTLCRFEGMPYRDIAETLDASEAAVKSLIHRATVAVARQLEPVLGANPLARATAGAAMGGRRSEP